MRLGISLFDQMREDLGIGLALKVVAAALSSSRSSAKFSMMPLWTMAIRPSQLVWGWALTTEGLPWVAQRVWPIPQVASLSMLESSLSGPRPCPRGG